MIMEHEERMSTMCGLVIDDSYIMWSAGWNGNLYKMYLKDMHIELVKELEGTEFQGKLFSCMLRSGRKIYFISLFGGYNIVEYDLNSNHIRTLYNRVIDGMQIYKAFLIQKKIYLFPSRLGEAIGVFSIESEEIEYQFVKWEEMITDTSLDMEEHLIASIECKDNILYGVIGGTNYMFKIIPGVDIRCEVYKLNTKYRIASISLCAAEAYITLVDKSDKVICIKKSGENKEIMLNSDNKIFEEWPFGNIILHGDKIFLLPNRGEKLYVINRITSEQKILTYPSGFHRCSKYSLFAQPILHDDKLYLLPYCGNGIIILDLYSCKMEFLGEFMVKNDLKKFIGSKKVETIREKQTLVIGESIHRTIMNK